LLLFQFIITDDKGNLLNKTEDHEPMFYIYGTENLDIRKATQEELDHVHDGQQH